MNQLSILSRDAKRYAELIEQAHLPGLQILEVHDHGSAPTKSSKSNILLADPDLGAVSLRSFSHLQWIQSTWAGTSPFLRVAAHQVIITGVKDVFGAQMREYVFAYLLYYCRQVSTFNRLKQEKIWQPQVCESLAGKTLGLFGVGSIGREVAKTAKHFDMKTIALSHSSRGCKHIDQYIAKEEMVQCASAMDYVVLLLPDTSLTRNLITANFLNALPQHCVLINAGRGQVVDEDALVETMRQNKIKAAVLDVFKHEPLSKDHPFWQLDNVIITQHTSAISKPEMIVNKFIENYRRFVQGKTMRSEIDRNKGY